MKTGRVALLLAALALATMVSLIPARAEEGNEAALKRQLEDVKHQLRELQVKVQRMESELGATHASTPAAVAAPTPSSTPAPASMTPSAGSTPPATPAMPFVTESAPTPSSTVAPAAAIPSTVSQPSPAPVRVEAGTSPSSAAVPDAFQWREMLKDQWHSVKAGMNSEEIRKLLGTPSREFTLDGKPVWYYTYPGIGNGSVMFSRDGHTVAGWQHPPYGFW
jgi:hypothetical protein